MKIFYGWYKTSAWLLMSCYYCLLWRRRCWEENFSLWHFFLAEQKNINNIIFMPFNNFHRWHILRMKWKRCVVFVLIYICAVVRFSHSFTVNNEREFFKTLWRHVVHQGTVKLLLGIDMNKLRADDTRVYEVLKHRIRIIIKWNKNRRM